MYSITFDPGKTTGVLVMSGDTEFTVLLSDEIIWEHRFAYTFDLIQRYACHNPVIICEDFVLFDRGPVNRSNTMPSSQVIGCIQMALYANNLDPDGVFFYPPNVKSDRSMLKVHLKALKPSSAHCLDAYKVWVYHAKRYLNYAPTSLMCYNSSIKRGVTRKVRSEL